jgi:predicted RND superfamily exporter protein
MDIEVRTISTEESAPQEVVADSLKTNVGQSEDTSEVLEPITNSETGLLGVLGIDEALGNLPPEDRQNLTEVGKYIEQILKQKGVTPTSKSFAKAVNDIKMEMEMDFDIERVGSMVRAWRDVGFVKDPAQKRSLFMKLARAKSSKEMNNIVFESMERSKVWQ